MIKVKLAFEGVLGTHTHSMSTKFSLNDISTFNRKIKDLLIFLLKICFDFFTISYLWKPILLRQSALPKVKMSYSPCISVFQQPPPMQLCVWPQIPISGGLEIIIDGSFARVLQLGYHETMDALPFKQLRASTL